MQIVRIRRFAVVLLFLAAVLMGLLFSTLYMQSLRPAPVCAVEAAPGASAQEDAMWKTPDLIRAKLTEASDGFVKHDGSSVQIWAASMDWFLEEWGRDTFISLPGLLLATRRFDEARENIRRFSRFEHDGLIPNRIKDPQHWSRENPEGAEYNTADAPMWFIQAVKKTAEASGDQSFEKKMAPVMRRIIEKYRTGTGYQRYRRFNRIYTDIDGLVITPAQATWMDADPEGRDMPVTPRNGKAVEINVLWYANLRYLAGLERRLGNEEASSQYNALADRVKKSFNDKFWYVNEEHQTIWGGDGGALRDVAGGDPHGDDVRPNMIFAVSHGGDLLSPERQSAIVLAVTRDLLTRYGLRTLSYRDSHYCERYDTSKPPIVKDQAYHQGTVWPWLMGPYADALARVRHNQGWKEEDIRRELRALLTPLIHYLMAPHQGTLPEVFDGGKPEEALNRFSLKDPDGLRCAFKTASDQSPGGTRSQAWSVAEILRVLTEQGLIPPPPDNRR